MKALPKPVKALKLYDTFSLNMISIRDVLWNSISHSVAHSVRSALTRPLAQSLWFSLHDKNRAQQSLWGALR